MLALIVVLFEGPQRAAANGARGAVVGASNVVGPVLGGLVIVGLGWRWAFGLLAVLFAVAALGIVRMPPARNKPEGFRFAAVDRITVT